MAFQHKEGKATLFHNDRKGNENAPSYTGDGMVNGQIVRIACWVNKTDTGETRLSLNIEEKQERPQSSDTRKPAALSTDFGDEIKLDDEIPF